MKVLDNGLIKHRGKLYLYDPETNKCYEVEFLSVAETNKLIDSLKESVSESDIRK